MALPDKVNGLPRHAPTQLNQNPITVRTTSRFFTIYVQEGLDRVMWALNSSWFIQCLLCNFYEFTK